MLSSPGRLGKHGCRSQRQRTVAWSCVLLSLLASPWPGPPPLLVPRPGLAGQPCRSAAHAVASTVEVPARIQAVVTDVDGTLFPFGTSRELSPGNTAALQRAIRAGLPVCLATGRIPGPWSDALRARLAGLGPGVFGNGALVLGPHGEVLSEAALPPEAVQAVCACTAGGAARGLGRVAVLAACRWEAAGPDYGSLRYLELAPDGPTWATRLIRSAAEPDSVLVRDLDCIRQGTVYKIVIFTDPKDVEWAPMPKVIAALREELRGTGVDVLDCGERQCEILPPGVNKGTGVLRLLEHIGGIPPSAIMACGDAENDVEMLKLAGIGVAMGNAKPEARAAADQVVATNDEDGVAEAVTRFVFGEPWG